MASIEGDKSLQSPQSIDLQPTPLDWSEIPAYPRAGELIKAFGITPLELNVRGANLLKQLPPEVSSMLANVVVRRALVEQAGMLHVIGEADSAGVINQIEPLHMNLVSKDERPLGRLFALTCLAAKTANELVTWGNVPDSEKVKDRTFLLDTFRFTGSANNLRSVRQAVVSYINILPETQRVMLSLALPDGTKRMLRDGDEQIFDADFCNEHTLAQYIIATSAELSAPFEEIGPIGIEEETRTLEGLIRVMAERDSIGTINLGLLHGEIVSLLRDRKVAYSAFVGRLFDIATERDAEEELKSILSSWPNDVEVRTTLLKLNGQRRLTTTPSEEDFS